MSARSFLTLAAVCVALSASQAQAQFVPGWGFGWGGWDTGYSASVNAQEQGRQQAMQLTQKRNANISSGVRNTLLQEANTRAQSQIDQRQSGRDWWLQTQQQQMAQRPAPAFQQAPIAPVGLTMAGQGPSPPQQSLIHWPAALRGPRFSDERIEIEAPFARFADGGAPVTAAEYEGIIAAAGRMKQNLQAVLNEMTAAEYFDAQNFLDQLIAEARERIAATNPPAEKPQ